MSVCRWAIVKRLSGSIQYTESMRKHLLLFSVTLALLTGLLAIQRRAPFDSRLIAFRSDRNYPDKSRSSLYVMSTNGNFVRRIIDSIPNMYCLPVEFSTPESDWFVFRASDGLESIRNFGLSRTKLDIPSTSTPSLQMWSQDGKFLILSSSEEALFAFDGHNITRLTGDRSFNRMWGWSPDGQWVYYSAIDNNIFRVKPDGTSTQQLTFDGHNKSNQGWSPDGQWLYYTRWEVHGEYWLHRMTTDGSVNEQLLESQTEWIDFRLWEDGLRQFGPLVLIYRHRFEPFSYWHLDDPRLVLRIGDMTHRMRPDGSDVTIFYDSDQENPYRYQGFYYRHPDGPLATCKGFEYVRTIDESPTGRGWIEDNGDNWKLIRVPTSGPNGWELYWIEDDTVKNITNHPGDDEFITWMTGEEKAFSGGLLLGLAALLLVTREAAYRQ